MLAPKKGGSMLFPCSFRTQAVRGSTVDTGCPLCISVRLCIALVAVLLFYLRHVVVIPAINKKRERLVGVLCSRKTRQLT